MSRRKGLRHKLSGRRRSTKRHMNVVRVEEKTKVKFPPFLEFEITKEKRPSTKAKASDRSKRKAKKPKD